jgi:hypothetical protein
VACLAHGAAREAEQRLALGSGQHSPWRIEALCEALGQLSRRDQIGNDDGTPARARTRLHAVAQVSSRRASRKDNQTIARVERLPLAGESDGRLAKRAKVSNPNETC